MKRIKPYVFAVLVIMTVMCLSACGSNKNSAGQSSEGSSSAAETTMESSSAGNSAAADTTSRNADEDSEESTGVIDGMMNDVEEGVDDLTGESNGHPTTGADESSAAQ